MDWRRLACCYWRNVLSNHWLALSAGPSHPHLGCEIDNSFIFLLTISGRTVMQKCEISFWSGSSWVLLLAKVTVTTNQRTHSVVDSLVWAVCETGHSMLGLDRFASRKLRIIHFLIGKYFCYSLQGVHVCQIYKLFQVW